MSSFVMRTIKINSFLDQSANLEYLSASVSIFIFHMQLSADYTIWKFFKGILACKYEKILLVFCY